MCAGREGSRSAAGSKRRDPIAAIRAHFVVLTHQVLLSDSDRRHWYRLSFRWPLRIFCRSEIEGPFTRLVQIAFITAIPSKRWIVD